MIDEDVHEITFISRFVHPATIDHEAVAYFERPKKQTVLTRRTAQCSVGRGALLYKTSSQRCVGMDEGREGRIMVWWNRVRVFAALSRGGEGYPCLANFQQAVSRWWIIFRDLKFL
jgi:hypothetical protein